MGTSSPSNSKVIIKVLEEHKIEDLDKMTLSL